MTYRIQSSRAAQMDTHQPTHMSRQLQLGGSGGMQPPVSTGRTMQMAPPPDRGGRAMPEPIGGIGGYYDQRPKQKSQYY